MGLYAPTKSDIVDGMPGGPITDDTGQQILAAIQALTVAIHSLTQEVSDAGTTLISTLSDSQRLASSLQSGKQYTPGAG